MQNKCLRVVLSEKSSNMSCLNGKEYLEEAQTLQLLVLRQAVSNKVNSFFNKF